MKNQKGITLIALIITIIVMLILVGVTVNVALTGGLFDTARKAAIKHEIATIQDLVESEKIKVEGDKISKGKVEKAKVEETIKSLTNELIEVTIQGDDYIANVDTEPNGKCYKVDPTKLNMNTSKGKGETGDIFVVDENHNVYYIKSGATVQELPEEDEFWWKISEEDIETIKTAIMTYHENDYEEYLEEESGMYTIATTLVENYHGNEIRYNIRYVEDEGEFLLLGIMPANGSNPGISFFSETYSEYFKEMGIDIEPLTWYFQADASEYTFGVKKWVKGTPSILNNIDLEDEENCYLPEYVTKLINSFKKFNKEGEDFEKYIFGENLVGRYIEEIFDSRTSTFKEENVNGLGPIEVLDITTEDNEYGEEITYLHVKYNNTEYQIGINPKSYTESLTVVE